MSSGSRSYTGGIGLPGVLLQGPPAQLPVRAVTMRRKLAIAFLVAALVLTGTASSCGSTSGSPGVEVEDCDAEDYRNREDDCGFTDADRQKLKTPGPAKATPGKPTPANPRPVRTR